MKQNIFPKKIKIAIFFMITSGILLLGQFVYIISMIETALNQNDIFLFILANFNTLLIPILFILFAYFLTKKKKWAWFAAMVVLLKETVDGIQLIPLFFLGHISQLFALIHLLILISLIFLILERKNYWQIAS